MRFPSVTASYGLRRHRTPRATLIAWSSSSILLESHVPHQPLQAVARNGEYVVEIRNTGDGQSLSAAKNYFGWEMTNRPGNERDHDRTDVCENCITSQDHDRSAFDWRG